MSLSPAACAGDNDSSRTVPLVPLGDQYWLAEDVVWRQDSVDSSAPLYAPGGSLLWLRSDSSLKIIGAPYGRDQGSDSIWIWLSSPAYWDGAWSPIDSSSIAVCCRLTYKLFPLSKEISPGVWEAEKIPGDPIFDTIRVVDSADVGKCLLYRGRIYVPDDLLEDQTRSRLPGLLGDSTIIDEAKKLLRETLPLKRQE